jgi:hypothetical protein
MEAIKNLILNTFQFLEDQYFYSSVYKEESSDIFIVFFEVEYVNELKRRKIGISYTKLNVNTEMRHTFSASIIRLPYRNLKDFFSLSTYLKSTGKSFSTTLVNNFDEAKAETIFLQIATALKENALGIIDGEEWLEMYYPRKD